MAQKIAEEVWWNADDKQSKFEVKDGPWRVIDRLGKHVVKEKHMDNGKESLMGIRDCRVRGR